MGSVGAKETADPARAREVRRPRLLFLVTEDWYFCSHRLSLARAAARAGFDVAVATRVRRHGEAIRDEGIRLISLPWSRRSTHAWNELRTLGRLLSLYLRERPDLVHHVALKPVLYGSFIARLTRTPRVINALAGFGYSFTSSGKRAAVLRRVLRTTVRRLSNRPGTRVLVQNPDDERLLRDSGTVRAAHLVRIPGSGVDVRRFLAVEEPPGTPRVVLVSRMLWSKGVEEFVVAARVLRERGVPVQAVLVGDPDPENPQSIPVGTLEEWAGAGTVQWLHHTDDIGTVWANAHVAVLPSWREGLPKTLLEAAACGRPIVATDVPGCREVVVAGENGYLVPVRDSAALAEAIERLVRDPELRRRMGEAGRERAVRLFSEEVVIEKVLTLYREMLAER